MLEVNNVSVSYGNERIVNRVSFVIQPKETVSIVGESGSGKSTLLKAIVGLLDDNGWISGGTITFDGINLVSLKKDEMRRIRGTKIATVYQQAGRSMDPITKIYKQFHEAMLTKTKISRMESRQCAISCMKALSIKDPDKIINSYPATLSGGTNQRVALALAMVMSPKLILADEPTSALDVTAQVEVVEAMKALKEQCSAAILIVTHNIGVVAQMADKVGVMFEGNLVEWGTREQILSCPLHPYTQLLMNAVLRMDGNMPGVKEIYRVSSKAGCPFYCRCPKADDICGRRAPETREVDVGHKIMCHKAEVEEQYE